MPIPHRHIATLALLIILGQSALAGPYTKKLRTIDRGMSADTVLVLAGRPLSTEPVLRLYYGRNQVVVAPDSTITDIRLANKDFRPKIRRANRGGQHDEATDIAYLRIGMQLAEAYRRAGKPDSTAAGEDWYYTRRHRVELAHGRVCRVEMHIKKGLDALDWVWLNFSSSGLLLMNLAIALVMFGVALQIKPKQFKLLMQHPKPVIVGFMSQFVGVPLVTFLLVMLIHPTPSVALGMILVAACPGGNVSNFISSIAKGNVALSITLSAIATLVAIFMTPLNFSLWGKLYADTSNMLIPIHIDPIEMLKTVLILLGIPTALGIWVSHALPKLTERMLKPLKMISMLFLLGFIAAALLNNWEHFVRYIHLIMLIVIAHNALCLLSGYGLAGLFRLARRDRRTIAIETGIQNSGLGLVLIFNPNLFDGLGGMAMVAALWGIWHIVSGFALAAMWSRLPLPER